MNMQKIHLRGIKYHKIILQSSLCLPLYASQRIANLNKAPIVQTLSAT